MYKKNKFELAKEEIWNKLNHLALNNNGRYSPTAKKEISLQTRACIELVLQKNTMILSSANQQMHGGCLTAAAQE